VVVVNAKGDNRRQLRRRWIQEQIGPGYSFAVDQLSSLDGPFLNRWKRRRGRKMSKRRRMWSWPWMKRRRRGRRSRRMWWFWCSMKRRNSKKKRRKKRMKN
jgi:hypothetical protein